MKSGRLTIRLNEELRKRLSRLARERATPASELVREAVEAYCRGLEKEPTCLDLAMKVGYVGSAKHAPPDLSTNKEHFKGFGKDK